MSSYRNFDKVFFAAFKVACTSSTTFFLAFKLYLMPNNLVDATLSSIFRDLILALKIVRSSFFNANSSITFLISLDDTPTGHLLIGNDICSMLSSLGTTQAPCFEPTATNYKGMCWSKLGFKLPPLNSKKSVVCCFLTIIRWPTFIPFDMLSCLQLTLSFLPNWWDGLLNGRWNHALSKQGSHCYWLC